MNAADVAIARNAGWTAPACYGECCQRRGECVHYAEVELPGERRVVATCRTPEGGFPLFEQIPIRREPMAHGRAQAPTSPRQDAGPSTNVPSRQDTFVVSDEGSSEID